MKPRKASFIIIFKESLRSEISIYVKIEFPNGQNARRVTLSVKC